MRFDNEVSQLRNPMQYDCAVLRNMTLTRFLCHELTSDVSGDSSPARGGGARHGGGGGGV